MQRAEFGQASNLFWCHHKAPQHLLPFSFWVLSDIFCTDAPPGYIMAAGRIPGVSNCAAVISWPFTKSRENQPGVNVCKDWNCCRQLCDSNANCTGFALGFQRMKWLQEHMCHWTGNDCCFTFSLTGSCLSTSSMQFNNYNTFVRTTGILAMGVILRVRSTLHSLSKHGVLRDSKKLFSSFGE